jgi:chaperonin cofactor prefoldin
MGKVLKPSQFNTGRIVSEDSGGNDGGDSLEARVAVLEYQAKETVKCLDNIEERLNTVIDNQSTIRTELANYKSDIQIQISGLKTHVSDTETRMLKWIFSAIITAGALATGIAKLL